MIESPTVSRRHAVVRITDSEVILEDLGSKNGTFVGGRRVEGAVNLADRDRLRIGLINVTLRVHAPGRSTETAKHSP